MKSKEERIRENLLKIAGMHRKIGKENIEKANVYEELVREIDVHGLTRELNELIQKVFREGLPGGESNEG